MQVEVVVNGTTVTVTCPNQKCSPKDRAEPRLIEAGRFLCPTCGQEFVAFNTDDYVAALQAERPALLVVEILRRI